MNGRDYVAKTRLSLKDGTTVALPGATCENVPAKSLPWLLDKGRIERAPEQVDRDFVVPEADEEEG